MRFDLTNVLKECGAALRFHKYLLLAIAANILAIQGRAYATANGANLSQPGFFVSTETAVFFLIGVLVFVFYIRGMIGVLSNAAKTYDFDQDDSHDTYAYGLIGTILAVIASAVVIWSYGLSSWFLYLGPVLCILSPIAITYCMSRDIQKYKELLDSRRF